MNITRENTGDLKVIIKIEINESDYIDNYNKSLKTYQHKAKVPGFRPGKIPMSYVINSYGNTFKFEELNKISSESIEKYIEENNIDYIFTPIMKVDNMSDDEWIKQKDFVYTFELILRPQFDFDVENTEVDYYNIIPKEEMIDKMIKETLSNYGEIIPNDCIEEESSVNCSYEELDVEGNIKENGLKDTGFFKIEDIKDNDIKNKLLGLKVNDTVVFNPYVAFNNNATTERFLKVTKDDEALKSNYNITINEIQSVKLAEMNIDLYKNVYPKDDIQNEEQFHDRVKVEASTYFVEETDQIFYRDALDRIIYDKNFQLPDETIKKALLKRYHSKLTKEDIEKDYYYYRNSIIYMSFEDYLKKNYDFKVTYEDIKSFAKYNLMLQFESMQNIDEKLSFALDNYAEDMLKDKKQYTKMSDKVTDILIIKLLKEKVKLNIKDITFDEYVNMASDNQHYHNHNHKHNQEHDHEHEDHHSHEHEHEHEHDHQHSH